MTAERMPYTNAFTKAVLFLSGCTAVLTAFFLPISTLAVNVLFVTGVFLFCLSGQWTQTFSFVWQHRALFLLVVFFGWTLVGLAYTTIPFAEAANALTKYGKLLLGLFFIPVFRIEKWRRYALQAFLLGTVVVLLAALCQIIGWIPPSERFGQFLVFKDRIHTSFLTAMGAYFAILLFFESTQKGIMTHSPSPAAQKERVDLLSIPGYRGEKLTAVFAGIPSRHCEICHLFGKSWQPRKYSRPPRNAQTPPARPQSGRAVVIKYLYLALFIATVFFLFSIDGRSGYFVFSIAFAWLLWSRWRWKGVACAAVCISLLLTTAYVFSPAFNTRMQESVHDIHVYQVGNTHTSLGQRAEFAKNSLTLIQQHPWFGTGTGSFTARYASLGITDPVLQTRNPHNQYLHVWVQWGIVGLILLLWLFFVQWKDSYLLPTQMRQVAQGTLLAIIFGSLANSWLLDMAEGHFYAYFIALTFASQVRPTPLYPFFRTKRA